MLKRYVMPCFQSHQHGLEVSDDGYIVQYTDYEALKKEKNELENEVKKLQAQVKELTAAAKAQPVTKGKKKKSVSWAVKVPFDEDDWIFVTEGDEIKVFDSEEEANKFGTIFNTYRVEKVK